MNHADSPPARGPDATSNGAEALQRALDAHREAYKTKIGTIEADLAAGQISGAQAREAARGARAIFTRDSELAQIAHDTGWLTWAGVGGVLYARRPKSSPPRIVRAPSPQALREAIEASNGGAR